MLIGGVILLYLYSIYKPKFDKWKQQQQDWKDMEEAKKSKEEIPFENSRKITWHVSLSCHLLPVVLNLFYLDSIFFNPDPEKAHKIQMSMEEARLKLQQRITVDAERKKQQQLQVTFQEPCVFI